MVAAIRNRATTPRAWLELATVWQLNILIFVNAPSYRLTNILREAVVFGMQTNKSPLAHGLYCVDMLKNTFELTLAKVVQVPATLESSAFFFMY